MPNITLRLTDEQHAELKQEAADAHRSMQNEIIHRLFVELPALSILVESSHRDDRALVVGASEPLAPEIEKIVRPFDAEAADEIREDHDRHFKPDPKPGKKK
jgi:hypothetical protein